MLCRIICVVLTLILFHLLGGFLRKAEPTAPTLTPAVIAAPDATPHPTNLPDENEGERTPAF